MRQIFEFPVKRRADGSPRIIGDRLAAEVRAADSAFTHASAALAGDLVEILVEKEAKTEFTELQAQAVTDAYEGHTGDPTPEEVAAVEEGKAVETSFRDQVAQHLQTLDDATRTKAAWDGLTAAQRQEVTRMAIQGLVRAVRFIAKRFL